MAQKKKWLPRQQSDKLGRKGHLVILSKKDKQRSKRDKGKHRREYMRDHGSAGVFYYYEFTMFPFLKLQTYYYPPWEGHLSAIINKPKDLICTSADATPKLFAYFLVIKRKSPTGGKNLY